MPGPEYGPRPEPTDLPPELAEFLRGQEYVCLTQATDLGTALIIKAPGKELLAMPGRVPIGIRHELYDHPSSPVIRMAVTILDNPQQPLALETFINVEDPQQRGEYAALAEQEQIPLLFYDEDLRRRRAITVTNTAQETVGMIVREADSLLARIPAERFSFERAKAAVMRVTTM